MNFKRKHKLLDEVKRVARAASNSIMDIYGQDFAIKLKNDGSPLTKADQSAHRIIQKGLAKLSPRLPVLSEESSENEVCDRRNWESYWLVDPLDGTKEFVKKNDEFTVNIALVEKNRATLGVIIAPALRVEYSGSIGLGAWCQHKNQAKIKINTSLLQNRPTRVMGSRSHQNTATENYIKALGDYDLKEIGSSIKTCYIADGQADVYPRFGPTSEWDTAASQAILESAGGGMIDLAGKPLRYNTKNDLLNPHFVAFGDPAQAWLQDIHDE
jgi:3'(2'), 5'-bisphosphate nucleotidase